MFKKEHYMYSFYECHIILLRLNALRLRCVVLYILYCCFFYMVICSVADVRLKVIDSVEVGCACVACARAELGLAAWPAWLAAAAARAPAAVAPVARLLMRYGPRDHHAQPSRLLLNSLRLRHSDVKKNYKCLPFVIKK